MTDLFSKFDPLIQQREDLLATGVTDPFSLVMEKVISPTVALCNGRETILLGTYNYMALGVAGTAVVVMLLMANPAVMQAIALGPMKWVIFAALLGLGWFAPRLFFSGSTALAHGAFWAYCALWGVLISPMIVPTIIAAAG